MSDDVSQDVAATDPATDVAEARRRLYWELQDFSVGRGLEIGPLHRTMVPRDRGDVRYLDVKDRDALVAWNAEMEPDVVLEDIPEIDYTLVQPDGRTLTMVEAAGVGGPYDWVVASHVIEHVPDLIGWLQEMAELVVDGGVLVLAVPDKNYTFDVYRPLTSTGQLVDAHLLDDRRPSLRAVYDHYTSKVQYNHEALWGGHRPFYDGPAYPPGEAARQVARSREGEYIDCHVWLFTPDTFLRQMRELRRLHGSPWYVEELVPTPRNEIEFRVRMRRIPRDADSAADDHPGEVVAQGDRPQWVDQQQAHHRVQDAEHRVSVLADLLELTQGDLAASQRQLGILRQREERHRRRLADKSATIGLLRAKLEKGERRAEGPRKAAEPGPDGKRSLAGRLRSLRPRRPG